MEQVNIGILRREEIQEAAKVVGRALAPTPFTMAMCQGPEKSERFMEAIIKVVFGRFPGQVLAARKGNRVVGVIRMVEWPQCQMLSRQGWMLLPSMFRILGFGLIRHIRGKAVWAKHDPKEPHWHLDTMAVMPEMQGQGIGSQLLKRFCVLVDEARTPAYLETDRPESVRFYERFGFSVVGEAPALGVRCYFMWRPSPQNAPSPTNI
jgi:ribosomal protein S18 acetylase RimI-like enzyme